MENIVRIGIITVSDRASSGEYEDRGGPAIEEYLEKVLTSNFETIASVIPDEKKQIVETIAKQVDELECCLVITTGGTGPALRDVTPEATEAACNKMMPRVW